MSESKRLICDMCGQMTVREGHSIPKGWMHIEAWYRPEDAEGTCSGCAGIDLCTACVIRSPLGVKLRDLCVKDYAENVINRRED